MSISERIFLLLQEKNISQKDFSVKTGIAQSTISDWKRKGTNPASDKIMLICDVLGITPYELLSGIENESYRQLDYITIDKKSDEYTILSQFQKLSRSQKARVLGYLQALSDL